MRIITASLLLAGALALPTGASAQHYGPPGSKPAAPTSSVRVIPLNNLSSEARTIEITASANTKAPAPVAPQLRGTTSEPASAPEPKAEGLRSALTGVPRDVVRSAGRVARGPVQSFEAPHVHVAANNAMDSPIAVSFEELN